VRGDTPRRWPHNGGLKQVEVVQVIQRQADNAPLEHLGGSFVGPFFVSGLSRSNRKRVIGYARMTVYG